MSTSEAGFYLDENLDFEVDENGDVRSSTDLDEVAKDAKVTVIELLGEYGRGRILRPNLKTRLESRIRGKIRDDPRVIDVAAEVYTEPGETTIKSDIMVVTDLGEFQETIDTDDIFED